MDLLDEAQKKADATNTQTHTVPDLSELLHAVPPATDAAQNTEPQPQNTVDSPPAFDIHSFDTPASTDSNSQPSPVVEDSHFVEQKTPGELVPEEPAPLPPQDPVIQNFGAPEQQKNATDPLLSIPAAPTAPPPQKKKGGFKRAFLFAGVAFLLLAVPVIGFFVNQQRQIADTRSKAGGICCEGGSCNDGWEYGPDSSAPQSSCEQRKQEACANRGGPRSGGGSCSVAQPQPTNPPAQGNGSVCESGGSTARVCYGVTVGNNCNGFNGTCVKNGGTNAQGYAICGCVATSPTPNCIADGLELPAGKNCCSGRGYSNADTGGKTICGTTTATPRSARSTNTPNPTGSSSCGGLNEACCVRSTCDTGLRCENVPGSTVGKCITSATLPTCSSLNGGCIGASSCPSGYTALNGSCGENSVCCTVTGATITRFPTQSIAPNNDGKCSVDSDSLCIQRTPCTACQIAGDTKNNPNMSKAACKVSSTRGSDGRFICTCAANNSCTNPTATPTIPTSGGGGSNNPSCVAATNSCESGTCCSGLVCQGVLGSRKCERPTTPPDAQCKVGGNTTASCGRILAFHCNSSFASECLENPQQFDTREQAIAYINGCGQLDVVCNGGPNENKLCGDFTIYKNSCGQNPTSPPQPTTPPAVAQCQNIKIYRNGAVLTTNQFSSIKSGQQLVIAVVGANATKARFTINTQLPIETTTKNSAGEYTITYTVPEVTTATNFTIQAEVFGNNGWK